jgi:hypothetical protein
LASLSICWFVCVCLQNFNVGHISWMFCERFSYFTCVLCDKTFVLRP